MTKRKSKTPPPEAQPAPVAEEARLTVEAFQRALGDTALPAAVAKGDGDTLSRPEVVASLKDFFAEFDVNEAGLASEGDVKKGHRQTRVQQFEDYLTFALDREVYGLPISKVREIIKPLPLTFVPRQPEHVAGVLSLRGNVVPIFALKLKLGLGALVEARSTRIVVVEDSEELIGFFVDQVRDVMRINQNAVEASPSWRGSQYQDIIRGVGRSDDQMIILLEYDALLNHLRAA